MFVNSDLTDLLSLFNARDVRYLVVGGYAVVQHAEPRFTNDLDLCIGADKRNAVAVFDALRDFGAPLEGLAASDFEEEGYFYRMGTPPSRGRHSDGYPGGLVQSCVATTRGSGFRRPVGAVHLPRGSDHGETGVRPPQDLLDVESLLRGR